MIVNLQEYKKSKEFEDIYQLMFLTQINKIMGVSKDAKNILAKLYCCKRGHLRGRRVEHLHR